MEGLLEVLYRNSPGVVICQAANEMDAYVDEVRLGDHELVDIVNVGGFIFTGGID